MPTVNEVKERLFEQWARDALALQCSMALAAMDPADACKIADQMEAGDFSIVVDESTGKIEFTVGGDLLFSVHVSELRSPSWLGLDT
jgi:hypothetical protein